jgi:ABC-type Na+ efflux pump permease subunit
MSDIRKIGLVAKRDFVATVATKGFVFGLLIFPAVIALAALVGPRILAARSPQVVGEVAIIDSTGLVTGELRSALLPSVIEARRTENARRAFAQAAPGIESTGASEQAIRQAVGQVPMLTLLELPPASDLQREKDSLTTPVEGGQRRLALVVIHGDAVTRAASAGDFGSYDLYAARAMDDSTEDALQESLREALVNARLKAGNLDPATITAMMRVPDQASTLVLAGGEQRMQRGFTEMLPFVLGILMFVGIIMGGQGLMTSTVEEKSSRVVEVVLASVSPFELMAGKLIAQLGVGMIAIGVYVGLGFLALFQFAMFGLVDPVLVVYLVVFYALSYLVFGAVMMAIGAAVNEMNEAQSLFGPVMLVLMIPYMLSPIIGRAPNSMFAIVASFTPPINTFVMMSRLSSESPPPTWQVALTIVIGLAAAYAAVWFAAKVFRIGLLMHGKPPNFATLVRWARAA